jgi:VanZ like family
MDSARLRSRLLGHLVGHVRKIGGWSGRRLRFDRGHVLFLPPGHAHPHADRELRVSPEEPFVLPWLLPGAIISFIVSIAASHAVGRALRVRRPVALVMVLSLGIILVATLTPQWEALAFGARGSSSCDLSRLGLAPIGELLAVNDTSLNVLMFVPLGASIAFVPRSRRALVVVVAAIALPFAIEATQLLIPLLDRACESADVVDNLTGLTIGLAGGVVAGGARAVIRWPD